MPVGTLKNTLYGIGLPVVGLRPRWKTVALAGETNDDRSVVLTRVLRRHCVVGGCVRLIRGGQAAECYHAGFARLSPPRSVSENTWFRTASVAKMVLSLLVMRLQTLGKLDVNEDISAFWGTPIRNPHHPDTPIPLASLLSHTSGMVDSPLYYRSFTESIPTDAILADGECFSTRKPLEAFRYSNFAAGLCGCLLEKRFSESLETLAKRELFAPLCAQATFDLSTLNAALPADDYRVLPPSRTPAFDARKRIATAAPLSEPDPQAHFLLASGSLFVTAKGLTLLTLPLLTGKSPNGEAFLSPDSLSQMKTPTVSWPEPEVRMRHGMGLLELDDRAILSRRLFGHQGFAYGAVNGVFFDDDGNGFVSLNSGASERRVGHLSCLNRDLIRVFWGGERHG